MTNPERPEDARVYRASSGPVVLVLTSLLALFLLGDTVVRGSWMQMLLVAPWVLLGLWAVYELSFVSAVRVDAQGVVVQNMLRRTSFGWRRVRDIDFRWQLQFSLDDDSVVTCYGGPARSRPPRKRGSEGETAQAPTGILALSDIRGRWEAAPASADGPIRREWDVRALIALAALVLWAVGAVLVVNAG
ncbi:PH domain-containing protein [Microbacterium sp. 179-I 3D4 NHS]|uniref:PH domain-containing protein n=1 Tax=Microbacterium sp. 179-I 3D4 NHS TaxID=3142381 RepID=UPI0039A3E98D